MDIMDYKIFLSKKFFRIEMEGKSEGKVRFIVRYLTTWD